jgi:rhodanese-related sulfurtransferase
MSFWGHDSVATIDADRAAQEVEQSGAQLIDVGEPDEWFAGHLPHAILVEPELLDEEIHKLSKDKPVVVASRTNELSESVAASLHSHGFDVAMIQGGISAWRAAGHKLVKADGTQV